MSVSEVVSAVAAVFSAIGGTFAAVAAFRSAASARHAQASADEAERRSMLRQLVLTAKDVVLESGRCVTAAALAARSRKDLAIFTNNLGGPSHKLSRDEHEEKTKRAVAIQGEAKVFSDSPHTLRDSPPSELDRVLTKLLSLVSEARSLREDLERERDDLERQCEHFRRAAIEKGGA